MSDLKTNSKKKSTPQKQKQSKYLTSLELKNINDYLDPDLVFINFKKEFDKYYTAAQKEFNSPIGHLRYSFENDVIILHNAINTMMSRNDFTWIFTKPINHNDKWWKVKLFMDFTPKDLRSLDRNFDKVTTFLSNAESYLDSTMEGKSIRNENHRRLRKTIGDYTNYVTNLDGERYDDDEYYNLFAPFHMDVWNNERDYLDGNSDVITPRQALESGYVHNFSAYVMDAASISKRDLERTDDYKTDSDYTPYHHAPIVCKRNGLDYTDPTNLDF